MNNRVFVCYLTCISFLLLVPTGAWAIDAKGIVTRLNEVYYKMKTMQVRLETEMRSGDKLVGKSITDAKTIAGSKTFISIRTQAVASTPAGLLMIVDDGKVSWLYQEAQHRYIRRMHVPTAFQTILAGGFAVPFGGMNPNIAYKLLSPSTVDGASTYVLEYVPPDQKGVTVNLFIDQQTYHIRRAKIMRATQSLYSITTTIREEVINGKIPPASFIFVPPKGAIEVKITDAEGANGNTIPTVPVVPKTK